MQFLQTILSYLTPLLALALAAYLFIREHQRNKRTAIDLANDAFKTTSSWDRIKPLLAIALPNIITDAENKYIDPGTGELKMSYVMAQIMELLPPDWRGRVNDFELQGIIEKALEGARVIWDNLPLVTRRGKMEDMDRMLAEAKEEATAIVPAVVVQELHDRGLHLVLGEDGSITALPDNADITVTVDLATLKGIPVLCGGVPLGGSVEVYPPEGYHWELDGEGSVVAVPDEPASKEAAHDEPTDEDAAEDAQPTPEEAPAAEEEVEGPAQSEDGDPAANDPDEQP